MTSAWKALMSEADASAEVHQNVHDELQNDVIPPIKSWQKAKYVKSMMHVKATKDYEEEFKRVGVRLIVHAADDAVVSLLLLLRAAARHRSHGRSCTSKSTRANVNITQRRRI